MIMARGQVTQGGHRTLRAGNLPTYLGNRDVRPSKKCVKSSETYSYSLEVYRGKSLANIGWCSRSHEKAASKTGRNVFKICCCYLWVRLVQKLNTHYHNSLLSPTLRLNSDMEQLFKRACLWIFEWLTSQFKFGTPFSIVEDWVEKYNSVDVELTDSERPKFKSSKALSHRNWRPISCQKIITSILCPRTDLELTSYILGKFNQIPFR